MTVEDRMVETHSVGNANMIQRKRQETPTRQKLLSTKVVSAIVVDQYLNA